MVIVCACIRSCFCFQSVQKMYFFQNKCKGENHIRSSRLWEHVCYVCQGTGMCSASNRILPQPQIWVSLDSICNESSENEPRVVLPWGGGLETRQHGCFQHTGQFCPIRTAQTFEWSNCILSYSVVSKINFSARNKGDWFSLQELHQIPVLDSKRTLALHYGNEQDYVHVSICLERVHF